MATQPTDSEPPKPRPFNATISQPIGPQSVPKQAGLFNWIQSLGSPPASASGPLGSPPSSAGIAAAATANAANGAAKRFSFSRPRTDSSSLSHDEALNISRAGWAAPANSGSNKVAGDIDTFATGGSFEILPPKQTPAVPDASATAKTGSAVAKRRRSSSRYDQLGLMAAYSGGPQSF